MKKKTIVAGVIFAAAVLASAAIFGVALVRNVPTADASVKGCVQGVSLRTSLHPYLAGMAGTKSFVIGTATCSFFDNGQCGNMGTTTLTFSSLPATTTVASVFVAPKSASFHVGTSSGMVKAMFTATATLVSPGTSTFMFVCDDNYGDESINTPTTTIQTRGPVTSCSLGIASETIGRLGKRVAHAPVTSLSASVGDNVRWSVTSTDSDVTYYMNGTKNGAQDVNEVLSGYTNVQWEQVYTCADIGTYTRYAHAVGVIQPQQGSCTTNTVTVTVSDPHKVCTPPPPTCTAAGGFASSCANPAQPSSQVVSFLYPLATSTGVSFLLNVAPPGNSSVWNTGYYWSQSSSTWKSFPLTGSPYPGTTCSKPASGCWLTNIATSSLSFTGASVGQGALYVLTYDKTLTGTSTWSDPACWGSSGSCWRLSVFPANWHTLIDRMGLMTSFKDMVALAENNGYPVISGFNAYGGSTIVIGDPFTGKMLASYQSTKN